MNTTPTGRIKDAGHIMRMYGSNLPLFARTFFDAVDGNRIIDFKTRHHDSDFKWQYQGHDPYNHHGRFMRLAEFSCRQVNYTYVVDFESLEQRIMAWYEDTNLFGRDPRNYRGRLL